MEQEKNCKNCKYFTVFYNKLNLRFIPIGVGSCGACNNWKRSIFKHLDNKACELWEQCESKEEKRVKTVKQVIFDIHKQLERIEQVLFDEEIER